jgi:hypothetical protein
MPIARSTAATACASTADLRHLRNVSVKPHVTPEKALS